MLSLASTLSNTAFTLRSIQPNRAGSCQTIFVRHVYSAVSWSRAGRCAAIEAGPKYACVLARVSVCTDNSCSSGFSTPGNIVRAYCRAASASVLSVKQLAWHQYLMKLQTCLQKYRQCGDRKAPLHTSTPYSAAVTNC